MISQEALTAMHIALSHAVRTTTTPAGYNRYLVRKELNLSQHDQVALIMYAQKQQGRSIEDAADLIKVEAQKAVQKKNEDLLTILVVIGIALFLGSCYLLRETAYVFLSGLIAALYVLIVYLSGVKKRKAEKIWKEHSPDVPSALEALKEMEATLEGSPMQAASKPVLIGCLVVALASITPVIIQSIPDPLHVQLTDLLEYTTSTWVYDDALELIVSQGAVTEKGHEAFQKAWDEAAADSLTRYNLAILACKAVPSGFPADKAKACAADALANFAFNSFRTASKFSTLPILISAAPEAVDGTLYARLEKTDAFESDEVYSALTEIWTNLTLVQAMDMRDQVIAAEGDGDAFMRIALAGCTVEDARQTLPTITDPDRQLVALECYGKAITNPDDVLAFIRMGREMGYTPLQCYPQGAVIDLPTSHFTIDVESESLNVFGTYLILRRTEKEEPFETKTVPSYMWSLDGNFTSMFASNYDGNSSLGDAAYTVVLDTDILTRMDEFYIPQTFAECDMFIVADSIYWLDGAIRNTTYEGSKTFSNITKQVDVATYSSVQMLVCYDGATGEYSYVVDHIINESPALPASASSSSTSSLFSSYSTSTLKKYYLGTPDMEWLDASLQKLVTRLEESNWALMLALINYAE